MFIKPKLRARKSGEVEKLAQDLSEYLLLKTSILETIVDQEIPNFIISYRVHKSRVRTAYGGFINTGEDLFGLFDIFIIYKGKDFFIQVSDNLKRVLKPYKEFMKQTLGKKTVIIMGRVEDYERTIVWQVIKVGEEDYKKYLLEVKYSKTPSNKVSKIVSVNVIDRVEEQEPHWKKVLENPINKAIFNRLGEL